MVRTAGARQGFRRPPGQRSLHAPPFGAHLRQPELVGTGAGDHHEIDPDREKTRPGAKAFAAEPFHPVSSYGGAEPTGDDQTQAGGSPRALCLIGHEQHEMGSRQAAAKALRPRELAMAAQPSIGPKRERHYFL
jgi:hypothetical protein